MFQLREYACDSACVVVVCGCKRRAVAGCVRAWETNRSAVVESNGDGQRKRDVRQRAGNKVHHEQDEVLVVVVPDAVANPHCSGVRGVWCAFLSCALLWCFHKPQWWSIFSTHRSHVLQWCERGTLTALPVCFVCVVVSGALLFVIAKLETQTVRADLEHTRRLLYFCGCLWL